MDRMSPQDAMFLHIEDENNPMHIGNVSVFEGPPPTYGDLVRTVAANLPLVPRYRQRVRFVPFELGRPVWVDDAHFQILYHIRRSCSRSCPRVTSPAASSPRTSTAPSRSGSCGWSRASRRTAGR